MHTHTHTHTHTSATTAAQVCFRFCSGKLTIFQLPRSWGHKHAVEIKDRISYACLRFSEFTGTHSSRAQALMKCTPGLVSSHPSVNLGHFRHLKNPLTFHQDLTRKFCHIFHPSPQNYGLVKQSNLPLPSLLHRGERHGLSRLLLTDAGTE